MNPTRTKKRSRNPQSVPLDAAPRQPDVEEFAEWMASGQLPEVTPTRQQRGIATALAMIQAGSELLKDRALDQLSIENICSHAGTTVGAFYGRFENKEAFFIAMQRVQNMRWAAFQAAFERRHVAGDDSLESICQDMVALNVEAVRANYGVIRASLRDVTEGRYDSYKESGNLHRRMLARVLNQHLTHIPPKHRELRVAFAHQMVAGTLVHAILNKAGPLGIESAGLVPELVRMVTSYLRSPALPARAGD